MVKSPRCHYMSTERLPRRSSIHKGKLAYSLKKKRLGMSDSAANVSIEFQKQTKRHLLSQNGEEMEPNYNSSHLPAISSSNPKIKFYSNFKKMTARKYIKPKYDIREYDPNYESLFPEKQNFIQFDNSPKKHHLTPS